MHYSVISLTGFEKLCQSTVVENEELLQALPLELSV
jgi:hypothetical protein